MTDATTIRAAALERIVLALTGEVALLTADPLRTIGHIRTAALHAPNGDMPEPVQYALERMLTFCEAAVIADQNQR